MSARAQNGACVLSIAYRAGTAATDCHFRVRQDTNPSGAGFSLRGALVPLALWRTEVRSRLKRHFQYCKLQLCGAGFQPADPLSSGSSRLERRLRPRMAAPQNRTGRILQFPLKSAQPKYFTLSCH
jgi:hypothetical protein